MRQANITHLTRTRDMTYCHGQETVGSTEALKKKGSQNKRFQNEAACNQSQLLGSRVHVKHFIIFIYFPGLQKHARKHTRHFFQSC